MARMCGQCIQVGTKVPVMCVPIVGYPLPVRIQLKFPLCDRHAAAFNMDNFGDYMGSWYDMAADHLREVKKPAVNPFPDDPDFKWEDFIVDPDWHAGPKEDCWLEMMDARIMDTNILRQKLW